MKLALVGYGRMGQAVESIAEERGHEIALRVTSAENKNGAALVSDRLRGVDVAIDFSRPEAAVPNIERMAEAGINVVIGTTGWYDELPRVTQVVQDSGIGLIYAPNFSIGTQIFFRLARLAARLAARVVDYDPYVLEAHHRNKVDHPSGTARQLAEIVLEELPEKHRWEIGPGQGSVDPEALQIGVLRCGNNPGMHEFGVDGPDDRIVVRHEARSRVGFARGALAAAEWVQGRAGVFTLDDMLVETLD